MGSREEVKNTSKKPANSYFLLQMKMNEVVKSKKRKETQGSIVSKSNPSSDKSKSTSDKDPKKLLTSWKDHQSESTSDKTPKVFPPREKEWPSGRKNQNMDPNIPNRFYGDYFCEICDSHMNSEAMWEAHITGKRHIKNVKKGDPDSKYEDLDVESSIKHEIRNVKDPIVGLTYIHEIRRKEVGAPPLYTCFLCHTTFASVPMVIEHVLTLKHRLNYMKENSPNDYELLCATNLKKGQMEPLAEEVALKLEQKYGRGSVIVKQERIKQLSFQRALDSDDDDMPKKKKKKFDGKNPYVWKAVDCPKKNFKDIRDCREIIEERRKYAYSSDEEADKCKQEYNTKRPFQDTKRPYSDTKRPFYDTKKPFDDTKGPFHDTKHPFDDNHPDNYKSLTPSSRESSKREVVFSRTHTQASPEERYSHSRLPSREFLKKDSSNQRSPGYDPPEERFSHSSLPSREFLKKDSSNQRSPGYDPPEERFSHSSMPSREYLKKHSFNRRSPGYDPPEESFSRSRSYQAQEMDFESSKEHLMPSETKVVQRDSNSQVLKDFVQKVYALPTEIFLKIVLLKLENIEVKGIDELSLLSKVINKAQVVLCNKLPPDVQAVLKQKMSQHSESSVQKSSASPTVITQGIPSSSFSSDTSFKSPGSDFTFIKDILNRAKGNVDFSPSASQSIAPPQASYQSSSYSASYSGSHSYFENIDSAYQRIDLTPSSNNYSYNSAAVPSSSSGIPGLTLTEENRDAQSYNTYQSYSDHSSGQTPYKY